MSNLILFEIITLISLCNVRLHIHLYDIVKQEHALLGEMSEEIFWNFKFINTIWCCLVFVLKFCTKLFCFNDMKEILLIFSVLYGENTISYIAPDKRVLRLYFSYCSTKTYSSEHIRRL